MRQQAHPFPHDNAVPPAPFGAGPRTSFTLCACALTATGAYLGASWLSHPWLGLPMGIWIIGASLGAYHVALTRGLGRFATADLPIPTSAPSLSDAARAVRDWAASRARSAGEYALNVHDRVVLSSAAPLVRLHHRLRIGLDLPLSEFRAVLDAAGEFRDPDMRIEWVRIEAGRDDQADCRRHNLDALIRRASADSLRLAIPEHPGHDAAWHSWSRRLPLGYASVFPARVDAAAADLSGLNLKNPDDLTLAMRLAACGAILGRSPARLRVRDRVVGRGSLTMGPTAPSPELLQRWMLELAHTVQSGAADPANHSSPAWQAAARLVQAWLVSGDSGLSPDNLRRRVEAADRFLRDEPESPLRVAAACFAAYDDEAGMAALHRAHALLRARAETPAVDPLAFILSEIEVSAPKPLTVGRVAAGICLLWATASPRTLEYLRADLIDDLRHTGGEAWRGKDGKLLEDIIAELDTPSSTPLPTNAAA